MIGFPLQVTQRFANKDISNKTVIAKAGSLRGRKRPHISASVANLEQVMGLRFAR